MKLLKTLQSITKGLTGDRSTKTLGSLLRKSLAIGPTDYRELTHESRSNAQRSTLDSLTDSLAKNAAEELNDEAKDSLEHLARIQVKVEDLDEKDEEPKLIRAFQDLDISDRYVQFDDPWDTLSTILKMTFSNSVLYSYLKMRLGLRDATDYAKLRERFFTPLHRVLSEAIGEPVRDKLYLTVFHLARFYGMPPVKRFKPEDVYTNALPFYHRHEHGSTITFSTSSGLPNPLERFGTDAFIDRYKIPEGDIGDLLLKNPFRVTNFADGILNRKIDCKRIYVWEKDGTSRALKRALEKVPPDKEQQFRDEATSLLAEALSFDRIMIIEIDRFDPWMKRFTRNAAGEAMFSLRGTESKRISEAIQVSFDLRSMATERAALQKLLYLPSLYSLLTQSPAGIAVLGLTMGEHLLHSLASATLRRPLQCEKRIAEVGRLVKDYDPLEEAKARSEAEKMIEELLR